MSFLPPKPVLSYVADGLGKDRGVGPRTRSVIVVSPSGSRVLFSNGTRFETESDTETLYETRWSLGIVQEDGTEDPLRTKVRVWRRK